MAIDFSLSDTEVERQRNACALARRHLAGVDRCTTMHPRAGLSRNAVCFPLYDGGNLGSGAASGRICSGVPVTTRRLPRPDSLPFEPTR